MEKQKLQKQHHSRQGEDTDPGSGLKGDTFPLLKNCLWGGTSVGGVGPEESYSAKSYHLCPLCTSKTAGTGSSSHIAKPVHLLRRME